MQPETAPRAGGIHETENGPIIADGFLVTVIHTGHAKNRAERTRRETEEDKMKSRLLLRSLTVAALCVGLAVPASPQTGSSPKIGPSNGQVVAIIVGAAAVIGVGGYLIYRSTHKHASIQGCVASDQNGLSLMNEKDKKTYALTGDSSALRAGKRVALTGRKTKDAAGKLTFSVLRVSREYGECQP
jgi:hypothetical protein